MAGPEVDGSGGATARSGGAGTGNAATVIPPSLEQMGATPSISGIPGTLRHDPELLGSPEAGWRRRKAAAEQKKGAVDSSGIELILRVLEHTRRSTRALERSKKPERGRGCPATKSRGGAGGASVEGST